MEINKTLVNPWDLIEKFTSKETEDIFGLDDILVKISLKIINYRISNELTQKQLAEKLNISQAMVSKLESGEYNPTIELLWKVSKKLGWSFDVMLNEETETQIWDTNEELILAKKPADEENTEQIGDRLGESA